MTFWVGFSIGIGIGFVVCSAFYMWLLKHALSQRNKDKDEFQEIQRKNGEQIGRIADVLEKHIG